MIKQIIKTFHKLKAFLIFGKNIFSVIISTMLIFLGFLFIDIYIYVQFIRERLPKDIPWELDEFRFYLLVFFCCTYIYIIKKLLYPVESNIIFSYIFQYLKLLQIPFISFDTFLKHNKIILPYYRFFMNYCIENFLDNWGVLERVFFIYILQLLPRIILMLIFIVDIIILHKIKIFYYFIFLSLCPLIYLYIIYSLNFELESTIRNLEHEYKKIWIILEDEYWDNKDELNKTEYIHHDTYVSIRAFIEIQNQIYLNNEKTPYKGIPISTTIIIDDYKKTNNIKILTEKDHEILEKNFYSNISKIDILLVFLRMNTITPTMFFIPQIRLIVFIGYLICWSFILGTSVYVFPPLDFDITLQILKNILYNLLEDPFSISNLFFSPILYITSNLECKKVKSRKALPEDIKKLNNIIVELQREKNNDIAKQKAIQTQAAIANYKNKKEENNNNAFNDKNET